MRTPGFLTAWQRLEMTGGREERLPKFQKLRKSYNSICENLCKSVSKKEFRRASPDTKISRCARNDVGGLPRRQGEMGK